ncbi:MAG TPA: ABC transporter ATP-binding protein [Acidimicrobiia bacterium]|nr:ABC transporter ATP-binding protein [Acidimicrobiia bacterium]
MTATLTATPLLELRDIDAGYGPFRALFDVSLRIEPGRVVALLGANGAGKTTIARVASGLVKPTSGKLLFEGNDITGMRTYRVARLGIAHAPEGRSLFASLTVEENLTLAFRRELGKKRTMDAVQRAYELFPRMGERRKQLAATLSGGEQRMLALARVLVNPPRLLIADELSLGLAPIVVDEVYKTLANVRDQGTALLLVEQHVHHALSLADDVAVLNKGQVTYFGPASELGDLSERLLPSASNGSTP